MAYQGEHDGLCGMYAVANAFKACSVEDEFRVFRLACRSLGGDLTWPSGIWVGTYFEDMKKMLEYCKKHIGHADQIEFDYPFDRYPPNTKEEYVKKLQEVFRNCNPKCAIVGTEDHWFTIKKENPKSKRFVVIDSAHSIDEEFRVNSPYLKNLELDLTSLVVFKCT